MTSVETPTVAARRAVVPSSPGGVWLAGVRGLAAGLAIAMAAAAAGPVVVPRLAGCETAVILTGSMTPIIQPGDVVIIRPVTDPNRDIQTGDVVTFREQDGSMVTHRVVLKSVSADTSWLTTRGDANNTDDAPIKVGQVVGKVIGLVSWIGYPINWASTHLPWVLGGAALLLLLAFGVRWDRPPRRAE